MNRDRILAFFLSLVFVFGTLPMSAHAEGSPVVSVEVDEIFKVPKTGDGETPSLQVSTGFVEVSLFIENCSAEAVEVILSYDAATLAPADWETGEAIAVDQGEQPWTSVPLFSHDNATDRYALHRHVNGKGYMRISALTNGVPFPQTEVDAPVEERKLAVTARFRILDDTRNLWNGYADTGIDNFPYFAIISAEDVTNDDLLLQGNWPVLLIDSEKNLYFYTDTTGDTLAKPMIFPGDGKSVKVTEQEAEAALGYAPIVFFDWDGTLLGSIAVPVNKVEIDPDTGEIVTDANGAPVVAKTVKIDHLVEEFQKKLMSKESKAVDGTKSTYYVDDDTHPLTDKEGYTFQEWVPYRYTETTTDDSGAVVTEDVFVPTSYGARTESNDNTILIEDFAVAAEHKVDFTQGITPDSLVDVLDEKGDPVMDPLTGKAQKTPFAQGLVVKAAYTTNEECELGEDSKYLMRQITTRRYTVTFEESIQSDTPNTYLLRFHVSRGNVPRLTQGIFLAYLYVKNESGGNTEIPIQVALSGADEEDVTVAVKSQKVLGNIRGIFQVDYTVGDSYALENWTMAANRANISTVTAAEYM